MDSPRRPIDSERLMQNSPKSVQLQFLSLKRMQSALNARVEELEGDKLDLEKQLQAKSNQVEVLREKLDKLKEENGRISLLEEELACYKEEHRELKIKVEQLQRKCDQVRCDREESAQLLAKSELEAIQLAQEKEEAQNRYQTVIKIHETCDNEKRLLNQEIESGRRQIASFEASIRRAEKEFQDYKNEVEMQKQVAKEAKEREIEDLISTNNEIQHENARRIKKLEQDYADLNENHLKTVKELEDRVAEYERKTRALNRKLTDVLDEANSKQVQFHREVERLKGNLTNKEQYALDLEKKRDDLERQCRSLGETLNLVRQDFDIRQQKFSQELEALKQQVAERDGKLQECGMQSKIFAENQEKLKIKLTRRDNTIKEQQNEIVQLKTREQELLQKLESKSETHVNQIESLHEQIKTLGIERDAAIENVKTTSNSKQLLTDGFQREKQQLDETISQILTEKEELQEKLKMMQMQCERHLIRISELENQSMRFDSGRSFRASFKSLRQSNRPSTGMSNISTPGKLCFENEDDDTMIFNGAVKTKQIYECAAPAPFHEVEEATGPDYARMMELRERNKKIPPHMRSRYAAELQGPSYPDDVPADFTVKVDENTPPVFHEKMKKRKGLEQAGRPISEVIPETSRSRFAQSSTRSMKEKSDKFMENLRSTKKDHDKLGAKSPSTSSRKATIFGKSLRPKN